MAQMQHSEGDCVWGTGRATSSPPDPVEDPEMSEAVAEERHEEVEQSNAVGDSDADRRQTLSRPPTLSGPFYEPGIAEGGGFENTFGQSLARPLLTAIDTRRLSTSPADLDSSDGRRSSTPPFMPLAKCGDGVTVAKIKRIGLMELQERLGLGLVSNQKPNVSVSSLSRKLRSRLHPCVTC